MKSNIFIPKTIHVGYQNRRDTYTGKLAYIIYTDEKGKKRKEASWEHWRDDKIEPEDFENVPTSGFVLNRHAGGVQEQWGWNARKSYIRIYDPRNFEFEITVENLLFILENCSAIKGKGIEGEFVYGWDGTELVLLPVDSPDYKDIEKYNQILYQNLSIKAADLILGGTYLDKTNVEWIYMGKLDYYSYGYQWQEDGEYKTARTLSKVQYKDFNRRSIVPYKKTTIFYGKYHWFANKTIYGRWYFKQVASISPMKIIQCIDDTCTSEYADIYEEIMSNSSYSPADKTKNKYLPYTFDEFKKHTELVANSWRAHPKHDTYYTNQGIEGTFVLTYDKNNKGWRVTSYDEYLKAFIRKNFEHEEKEDEYYWSSKIYIMKPTDLREIYDKLNPCYLEVYLQNGYLNERKCYYGNKE